MAISKVAAKAARAVRDTGRMAKFPSNASGKLKSPMAQYQKQKATLGQSLKNSAGQALRPARAVAKGVSRLIGKK